MKTTDYYDIEAQAFFNDTASIDMTAVYAPFLALLPPAPASILDAGCGSGRAARNFLQLGHDVEAFDAAPKLAALASDHLGKPVHLMTFDEVTFESRFDAVWACASLLHLPDAGVISALARLRDALKPHGILYVSFKRGSGLFTADGRTFHLQDEHTVPRLLAAAGNLDLINAWITHDQRPDCHDKQWVNALARRNR